MRIVDFPDAILERIAAFVGPQDDIFFRWSHGALAQAARAVHGPKPRTRLLGAKFTKAIQDCLDEKDVDIPLTAEHTLRAAQDDDQDMLMWLSMQCCPWHENTTFWAARNRQTLRLVLDRGCPLGLYMACGAAAHGDVEALRYAVYRGAPLMSQVYEMAAMSGDVAKVRWLLEQDSDYDSCVVYAAAKGGHLKVLELLDDKNGLNAASGDIGTLRYLRERAVPCPWGLHVAIEAIERGQLEVLKWLHANGMSMDKSECECAAREDDVRIFSWLRTVGCPCDRERCLCVAGEAVEKILAEASM
jgi:hypothetical protein